MSDLPSQEAKVKKRPAQGRAKKPARKVRVRAWAIRNKKGNISINLFKRYEHARDYKIVFGGEIVPVILTLDTKRRKP